MESVVHPFLLESTNEDGRTPRELFTETHKELVDKGEKWMKETATSCTVVGALIITIMFAAAITVPGGNDSNTGLPMFLNSKVFTLFVICDALSLLSSSASVLMFLGILTSHYAEQDFLQILTQKDDYRPFYPYLLYSNHDDNFLCLSFHHSTWKIMDGHSCHLPCRCSSRPIYINAISPSY